MKYRETRDGYLYHIFKELPTVGKYDMPIVKATQNYQILNMLPFNYINSCPMPSEFYLCFYIDDYQFERIWNNPDKTAETLKQFKGIIGPDFSLYRDMPNMLNIYNCWRNKVLMAYFQSQGIEVIPNVTWSDEESYSWCFDGLPQNSVVAVSTNGILRDKRATELFVSGFKEMLKRLTPTKIIIVGTLPKEIEKTPNIINFIGYSGLFGVEDKNLTYKGDT